MFKEPTISVEPSPEQAPEKLKPLDTLARAAEQAKTKYGKYLGIATLALMSEGCYGLMPQSVNMAWAESVDSACRATSHTVQPNTPDMCDSAEKLKKQYERDETWEKRDLPLVKRWKRLPQEERERLMRTYGEPFINRQRWVYDQ